MPTGKNKVLMAPLRAALENAGLKDVRSYIQSGNLVVSTALVQNRLETLVHDVIAGEFGGDIRVLARPVAYFRQVIRHHPFAGADPGKLYFTLLSAPPAKERLEPFLALKALPNQLELADDYVLFVTETSFSDLKIDNAFFERKLKVSATTRVYRTMEKLLALAEAD